MTDPSLEQDVRFILSGAFDDPGIINGVPSSEVGRRFIDLAHRLEQDPTSIEWNDLVAFVNARGTKIENPSRYLSHLEKVGMLYEQMTRLAALNGHELFAPKEAKVHGWCHDLTAPVSDRQTKELDLYWFARYHQLTTVATHIAPHSAYLEIAKLLTHQDDVPLGYENVARVLSGDGPLSYQVMARQFSGFLQHTGNLPLIMLSIADLSECGQERFNPHLLEDEFRTHVGGVIGRYFKEKVERGKPPELLGLAMYQAIPRLERSLEVVKRLTMPKLYVVGT